MKKLQALLHHEAAPGLLLMIFSALALILANSPALTLYDRFLAIPVVVSLGEFAINKPLVLWVNDGLMALFFLLVGLEIKREIFEGRLSSWDQVMLPGLAAVAGIAVPALIFSALNHSDPIGSKGWAIPSATDIAFALGIFSLFGKRLPLSLKLFLMSVAVFDDIGAIIIIAIFYSQDLSTPSLGIALSGMMVLTLMNRWRVPYLAAYMLVGTIVWVSVLKSGVHATLAGFALAWFIPLNVKNAHGERMAPSLEHALHPWVGFFILPLFAFANAGVSLLGVSIETLTNSVTLGIALGLFVGKQLGIFTLCWLAVKSGVARMPEGANWSQLYGVAVLCGVGFTMSLFIGSLAFEAEGLAYQTQVKMGVLIGSLASAILGGAVILASNKSPTNPSPSDTAPSVAAT